MFDQDVSCGVLLVNNLHYSKDRPALRFDENYFDTVTEKLKKVLTLAQERNLTPVFSGTFIIKHWDTSLFSHLARTFQEYKTAKPVIVLDASSIRNDGTVRSNCVEEVLSVIGAVRIVDQHTTQTVDCDDSQYTIGMAGPGSLVLRQQKLDSEHAQTLIHSDTKLPSLVRTQLAEKEIPSAVIAIFDGSVDEIVIDGSEAPIDDVAFDVAEEISTFSSEMVERLREVMSNGPEDSIQNGDTDLKTLCEKLNVSVEAREIIFGLKDEVSAEDL